MLETKDPAIKLFGKKIPLPAGFDELCFTQPQEKQVPLDFDGEDEAELEVEAEQALSNSEDIEQDDDHPPPDSNANPKTPSIDEGSAKSKMTSTEKDQSDEAEKTLKKPDKILPCPRCNSMDTKFCYYNNYNVNQPRHFCKSCQRYWTAGGTMRNVPVGAGRRKNKNSASHYRHITISEALQAAQIDASNGSYQPVLKTNVRVLSFGVDAPVCDSIASVLNLADEKVLNGTRNGFHKNEEQVFPAPKGKENGDDISCASSAMISKQNLHNVNSVPSQIPCIPSVPWPYPWNAAVPPPAFCPPGFPLSFCPAPYWNCGVPGTWNVPWFSPHPAKSPSSGSSSTLGKHSREEDNLKSDNSEKEEPSKQENGCVLVPKTLRIDDPSEAAKSSIWATLGIKNDSISGGGLFKAAFQSKSEPKKNGAETSPALLANPAALSRSRNFHERS